MLNAVRTPKEFLLSVWPLPRSLATTYRISVDFSSSPYLDVSVQAVPLHMLLIHIWMHELLHADCSIRKSADQCLLTTPRCLSQLTTSFFGSQCQGIHSALFFALPFEISFGSSQNFRVQLFVVFFTQHFGFSPSCRCFYLLVVFTCICFHYSVFKLHFFLSFSKNRYQQMIFFIYWYLLLQARHFFPTQSFSFKSHRVSLKLFLW